MSTAIITGSAGLIGSESARFFADLGLSIAGIDNDMRSYFFGAEASTKWNHERLEQQLGKRYLHFGLDIRERESIFELFRRYGKSVSLVIHAAAQPSHDWSAQHPQIDFDVNAGGTLNLLEAVRTYAPEAVFIFTSTNKVYGDACNRLPLLEQETRWEIASHHTYARGIREDMSIDRSLHSPFGASKLAADVMVQEYGRYFGMRTVCFRGGCLTGPAHAGTELHGFLVHLMRCAATGSPYTVFGYRGKQVRDNIHSADLVGAFYEFYKAPRGGEVYNIGGGRFSNCSILEAIRYCEEITGREVSRTYCDQNRLGDHMWWISDNSKFESHYPNWSLSLDVPAILRDIHDSNRARWQREVK